MEWKGQFKYLGSQFDSAGSLDTELTRRIQQATAGFQQLSSSLWRQKCVDTDVKMQVYRTLVSQVLLYGSHSWNLTAAQLAGAARGAAAASSAAYRRSAAQRQALE